MACVVSKLLYSLECECLRAADRNRLDGFHCRCLRAICKIPHPMISHTTNAEVFLTAGVPLLTTMLDKRQLLLYGRIAASPNSSGLRSTTFDHNTVIPKLLQGTRTRGRPRLSWIGVQHARALNAIGGDQQDLDFLFQDRETAGKDWQRIVNAHFPFSFSKS